MAIKLEWKNKRQVGTYLFHGRTNIPTVIKLSSEISDN